MNSCPWFAIVLAFCSGFFAPDIAAQSSEAQSAESQSAESQSADDYDRRIDELEASIAQLKRWRLSESGSAPTSPTVSAGYSFLFTKLHYKESFQATVSDLGTGTQHLIPFSNEHELTPRAWIGYESSSGLGVRGTFWNFDHASDPLTLTSDGFRIPSAIATSVIFPAAIVAPFVGDQLLVSNSLNVTTVDLEGTYELRVRRLAARIGAGVRYAHFDQRFNAAVVPGSVPIARSAALDWQREFEGLGPLVSATGKLPMGYSGLYGTVGGSLSFLFGDKNLNRTIVNDSTPAPNRGLPNLSFDDSDEITGVYAASMGLGWQRKTGIGDVWMEGAYESQLWTDGGAPTITFAGFNGFSFSIGLAR